MLYLSTQICCCCVVVVVFVVIAHATIYCCQADSVAFYGIADGIVLLFVEKKAMACIDKYQRPCS